MVFYYYFSKRIQKLPYAQRIGLARLVVTSILVGVWNAKNAMKQKLNLPHPSRIGPGHMFRVIFCPRPFISGSNYSKKTCSAKLHHNFTCDISLLSEHDLFILMQYFTPFCKIRTYYVFIIYKHTHIYVYIYIYIYCYYIYNTWYSHSYIF